MKLDIGYSSLTERIFIWKTKEAKWKKKGLREWVWNKEDITDKFLFVCEQFFWIWNSRIISQWQKETLYISIENTDKDKKKLIKTLQKHL